MTIKLCPLHDTLVPADPGCKKFGLKSCLYNITTTVSPVLLLRCKNNAPTPYTKKDKDGLLSDCWRGTKRFLARGKQKVERLRRVISCEGARSG